MCIYVYIYICICIHSSFMSPLALLRALLSQHCLWVLYCMPLLEQFLFSFPVRILPSLILLLPLSASATAYALACICINILCTLLCSIRALMTPASAFLTAQITFSVTFQIILSLPLNFLCLYMSLLHSTNTSSPSLCFNYMCSLTHPSIFLSATSIPL